MQPGQHSTSAQAVAAPGSRSISAYVAVRPVGAGRPGVPLQRAEVGRPHQRRGLVHDQVGACLARARLRIVPARQPLRGVRRAAACARTLGLRAVWEAVHVQRPAGQVRQDGRRDPRGVADDSRLVTGCSPARPGRAPCPGWSAAVRGRRPPRAAGPSASSAASSSPAWPRSRPASARPRPRGGQVRPPHPVGVGLTSSLVRPLSTDRGWSSAFQPSTAYSSCLCSSSHCSLPASSVPVAPGRIGPGASHRTCRGAVRRRPRPPPGRGACGSHVPASQTITSPPPYSPAGMTPSKSRYSMGWSSTWMAACRTPGSSVGPFGTAQLTSTPSISSRRS